MESSPENPPRNPPLSKGSRMDFRKALAVGKADFSGCSSAALYESSDSQSFVKNKECLSQRSQGTQRKILEIFFKFNESL
jgi:hypothetical protein